jgi:hypothetical protein
MCEAVEAGRRWNSKWQIADSDAGQDASPDHRFGAGFRGAAGTAGAFGLSRRSIN